MSKYRYLNTLAADLRAAGLDVVEIDGWKTRGRPASTGGFDPVGVLWHHTGGSADGLAYARWMGLTGRSDLPAPLCQLSIGRDGKVYVIAAGRANHAGKAKASGSVAAGDGNALYVGIECQNTGSEGWSKSQYAAMVKVGAVLGSKTVGCSVNAQRAHKETSVTGKWDPGMLDMEKFRADIKEAMAPKVAPKAKPAPKPASAKSAAPAGPTRVSQARDLLHEAAKHAGPVRKAKILAALKALPKR